MIHVRPTCADFARYNTNGAAEILGVHRNSIRNLADKGELQYHINSKGKRVFYGSTLKRYWDKNN
jgi:predicted site-specific integrase-resolvase